MASSKKSTKAAHATRMEGARIDDSRFDDARWRATLRRRLVAWYRRHARDLPWRRTRDPYHVWVSEIMLQQTQVVTVIPYFQRFLKRFPNIKKLAEAGEQDVLRVWEGLGYYRRARQLHRAARLIVERHDGQFPRDADAVRSLPGIGRYTAGAILSIAFDQRQPILEANTVRLFSRLAAFRGDSSSRDGQQYLWQLAESSLPRRHAGDFNQALMELGGTICTPRDPKCLVCPVAALCSTFEQGLQNEIPKPAKRLKYEAVHEAAIVIRRGGKVLLRRCGDKERWAGLWDFPRFAIQPNAEPAMRREVAQRTKDMTGLTVTTGGVWKTIKHGVTRFRITLACFQANSARGKAAANGAEMIWVRPVDLPAYPLSVTGRKICKMLGE